MPHSNNDNYGCYRDRSYGTFHTVVVCCALISLAFSAFAELKPPATINDGIDRSDPNFVTASLLVMSPGDELYSSMGHSCFRLECPTFKLDYCFSYESESAKGRLFSLLSGNLKMGMFAVPTQDYLKSFAQEGRGVVQYKLNLPPDVKQRLWKALDDSVAEGVKLPYDVLRRGCSQSMVKTLQQVLPPYKLSVSEWPEKFSKTRRELVESVVNDRPWIRLSLHTLSGMELDRDVTRMEKVVVPTDLLEFLRIATINGRAIIDSEGVELLAVKKTGVASAFDGVVATCFTPTVVSCVVVGLAVANFFMRCAWVDWLYLGFQSAFGLALAYLVFVSTLFGTNWNWLIVPFNLLPLVFWKWRKKWALWFAGVLVLWEAWMIIYPHRLTDPAYLVLVAAYVIFYASMARRPSCKTLTAKGGRC